MTPKARLSLFRKLIEGPDSTLAEWQKVELRVKLKDYSGAIDFASWAKPMTQAKLSVNSLTGIKQTSTSFIQAYERYLMIESLVKNKTENK